MMTFDATAWQDMDSKMRLKKQELDQNKSDGDARAEWIRTSWWDDIAAIIAGSIAGGVVCPPAGSVLFGWAAYQAWRRHADVFLEMWDSVVRELGKAVDKIGEALAGLAAPWTFRSRMDSWHEVETEAQKALTETRSDTLRALERWEGDTADDYSRHIDRQNKANERLVNMANDIQTMFSEAAANMLTMYAKIFEWLVKLAGGIAAAGVALLGINSMIDPGSKAKHYLDVVIEAVTGFINICADGTNYANSAKDKLTNCNDYYSQFSGGTWPTVD